MPKPELNKPGQWLYDLGVPHFHARAFGEYYENHCPAGMDYATAKQKFDYDPIGRELYRKHGSRIVLEWKDGKLVDHDAPALFDVTWGMGGPGRTIRCSTIEDAREVYDVFRAWGTVLKPAGECPWQVQARERGESDVPSRTYEECLSTTRPSRKGEQS